ncbi:hypothetical protein DUI87_07228 [Hirundo rustica rustica]|uniref:Uncharacterized protein n=1 Tax=Hirundo rustica rustica TaxID=333673 RepID=A0A3M0KPD3_HIRRU|nr:hypothetical protein DUI87_07228 [Hirundo rustica rustica]
MWGPPATRRTPRHGLGLLKSLNKSLGITLPLVEVVSVEARSQGRRRQLRSTLGALFRRQTSNLELSRPQEGAPPKAPPYYPTCGNAPMRSSLAQTTPPSGRRVSWTSGSHAPSSGSHDEEPEGVKLGPESMGLPQSSPVPSLAPAVYKNSRGGHNVRPVYHPFPQSTIRDLCKAHRDYGRESPYFRGLLRSDLGGAAVVPADLRQLFSCLMNSTEFKLWEAAWRQLLRDALPGLLTDPESAVDEEGNALTLDHLLDSRHQPYRLRLTEGLHLKNADWTLASVNTEEQGAWPVPEGEFIVIGD